MKKIVRQQNYLKGLIDAQDNKFITRQTLKNVIRASVEALLENPESSVVLYRILNQNGLTGLIKRIEFSDVESYNFSDESENLREKVWADTEFLCVLTHRFVVIFIWDNRTDDKNYVRFYSIWNSKLQDEALDIINRNSIVDVKSFQEKYRPDRRDNLLLNSAIRKLVENSDEAIRDAVLVYAEYQEKPTNNYTPEVREVAHEIRNQLSICDLYSEVIKKYCLKNQIEDQTIINGINCISRAVKMSANSLISLKSTDKKELKPYHIKDIIDAVKDLTKVYFECNNIEYIVESKANCKILCEENTFIGVLVNLIKNAVEAFNIDDLEENIKDGKYIKIKTEKRGEFVAIRIINNASMISEPENIFNTGYTTKSRGSGLGLGICKKTIEEQFGKLTLEKSDEENTEFLIKMGIV